MLDLFASDEERARYEADLAAAKVLLPLGWSRSIAHTDCWWAPDGVRILRTADALEEVEKEEKS